MYLSRDISYYIVSLGCPKNEVDAERLNADMDHAGFVQSADQAGADIIVINTCGFILDAKKESIQAILDAVDYTSKSNSEFKKRLVVLGCFTQRYNETVVNDIPEIDIVWGLYDSSLIDEIARRFDIALLPGTIAQKRKPLVEHVPYAYIKIADGCSNCCSYCAIPLIRGKFNAFPPELIIHDAQDALRRDVKELIVVAQDTAAYQYDDVRTWHLLEKLNNLDGNFWIRLMYCHPDHITDELIAAMSILKKVVPYLDIPFQHASKKILQAMNRGGDAEAYVHLVEKIRSAIPTIAIRSTFMVGFPGEDAHDFNILMDFVQSAQLDKVGVFMYSAEEGTQAYSFGDSVSKAIKKQRYNKLMKLQQKISQQQLQKTIGHTVQVLIEEKVDEHNYIGRTQYDAPEIDGVFFLTASNAAVNNIVSAEVTDTLEYDRIGEMI